MPVNNISLAVGQRWKTRSGKEVEITYYDTETATPYVWDLSNGGSVTDEGREWDGENNANDLITLIQDEHGFIPWNGGECPVPTNTEIEAKLRCGAINQQVAEWFDWTVTGHLGDIITYRVVKQKVEPTKVDAEEEDQPKQDKEVIKMNQKYTVKDVLYALDNLSEHYVELDLEEQIEEYLAMRESADYKLYLELKAKFE